MLNRGFSMLANNSQPVSKNTYVPPVVKNAPAQTGDTNVVSQTSGATTGTTTFAGAYNVATANAMPKYTGSTAAKSSVGGTGVQFGAFSSQTSANAQVANVKNKLGVDAIVEPTGTGLYRVRTYGMDEGSAQKLKSSAAANGIDSYVFH